MSEIFTGIGHKCKNGKHEKCTYGICNCNCHKKKTKEAEK